MPSTALYARVSTRDQDVVPQLDALRAYADARSLTVFDEYIDEGVSGACSKRRALDRLLADARRRRFDRVVVVKLDRLARSVRHLTQLGADFEALGVDLVVLDQAIDTGTPTGRLLFNVLGAIAEFERDLIAERVAAGMAAAKRRGKRLGRARAIVGPDTFRLEAMLRDGRSMRSIAREFGVSVSTVSRTAARLGAPPIDG